MEYQLTPSQAEFNKKRLAKTAGWVLLYHANETTREYCGASYDYVMEGVGIPAYSYLDAPTQPKAGLALVRSPDDQRWEEVADHRGEVVWDTESRQPSTIQVLGEIPSRFTTLSPTSSFDVWTGETWVKDKQAEQLAQLEQDQQHKARLLEQASQRIQLLTDKLELNETQDSTTLSQRLNDWRRYRLQVDDIIPAGEALIWPAPPE